MPRGYSNKDEQNEAEESVFAEVSAMFDNAKMGHTLSGLRYTVVDLPSGKTVIVRSPRDLDTLRAAQALT